MVCESEVRKRGARLGVRVRMWDARVVKGWGASEVKKLVARVR